MRLARRSRIPSKSGGFPVTAAIEIDGTSVSKGVMREIYPDADGERVLAQSLPAGCLQLFPIQQHIIRPFQRHFCSGRMSGDGIGGGKAGHETELGRQRRGHWQQEGREEIAAFRNPDTAPAAAAGGLFARHDPKGPAHAVLGEAAGFFIGGVERVVTAKAQA